MVFALAAAHAAGARPRAHGYGTAAARRPTQPRLAWARPRLTDPVTVHITSPTREIYLDQNRDYILKMPPYPVRPGASGGLWIDGGHNVVVIGGALDFDGISDPNETNGRVAAIFDATGIVHIEGLRAYGQGLVEGVQNYADNAVVQIENCRFDHLHGSAENHSDLLQFGVGRGLRVDRLTGSSNYQGLFLTDLTGPAILRHVNVLGDAGAQFLFWHDGDAPVSLDDIYIKPAVGRPILESVWPSGSDADPERRAHYARGTVFWQPQVGVRGRIHRGVPPGGDFVPRGLAGLKYVSPGYVHGSR